MQLLPRGLLAQDDMNVQFGDLDAMGANGVPEVLAGLLALWLIPLLIALVLRLIIVAGSWKMFSKAGKPGWAAIIPIYHFVVLLEITGKPIWWLLLLLVPLLNLLIVIIVVLALAERFGKTPGFAAGVLLLPFIFIPILGFGDATYQDAPAADT